MKVCMVAYASYYNDARIKAYVYSLEQRGVAVDLLMAREPGKGKSENIGRARVFYQTSQYKGDSALLYLLSYLWFFLVTFRRLSVLAVKERYCAVHVHNMPNALVFTALVPRLLGATVILDVHDLMAPNYLAKFDSGLGRAMVRLLVLEQRVSALMAHHVLCADHAQQEYLRTVCGVPARKLAVILNLPNEHVFQRTKREASQDPLKLVYHGTIARRLGIDLMVQAVAAAIKEVPVHLSVFGAGEFLPEAVELSRRLDLDGHVYFNKSFFPVEKISQMVGDMDLGVIGNRRTIACDQFMLPVKLLEYVYLGVPVVAPRLQIIRTYFDDSMVKFYDPEDPADLARCIVELYRSPEERRTLAENAKRFYEQYNWARQSESYVGLIPGVLR